MRRCEKTGKSVEEAIEKALIELNVSRDKVNVTVLEEPSRGFLGIIGNKDAKVLVEVKETGIDRAVLFLREVCANMGVVVNIEFDQKDDNVRINFIGDDLGILIGRRGDTLDSLQYLANLVANKNSDERIRLVLDVEGYRGRREDTLQKLAVRLAEKVRRKGHEVVLEPMNPHERRIIHTALQNNRYVYTSSQGEEPYRKIVISPRR